MLPGDSTMIGNVSNEIDLVEIWSDMSKSDITLSNQNRKIKNANIFNLPTGTTCKPRVLCSEYCYAKKAEKIYPAVRPSRMRNYEAAKRLDFSDEMIKLLNKSKYKVTRIHESGDFYSVDYIRKWYTIAKTLPDHTFYAYTKRDDLFDQGILLEKPSNIKLIYSVDGIQPDSLSIREYCVAAKFQGYDKVAIVWESTHTCPSTSKDKWKVACIKNCVKCIDDKTQLIEFAKH